MGWTDDQLTIIAQPHKTVNGAVVLLTPGEIAEIEAERAAAAQAAARLGVLEKIATLEATVTNRRMREAALTEAGRTWLAGVDAQISALRVQIGYL